MRRLIYCLFPVACACAAHGAQAQAQVDRYHITEAERVACTPDAERYCFASYPDEQKLMTCMKANRKALTAVCAAAFTEGLRSRGLH